VKDEITSTSQFHSRTPRIFRQLSTDVPAGQSHRSKGADCRYEN
jgi:hypothetical protein